jgi:hypothetical protein
MPNRLYGWIEMKPFQIWPSALKAKDTEAKPPHSQAYNLLFRGPHQTAPEFFLSGPASQGEIRNQAQVGKE